MDMFDDAFGSAPAIAAPSSDPAADFINREQADLGGLGMDFGLTSTPAPAPALVPEGDGTNSFFEPSTNDSSDMMNGLGDMASSGMPDFSSSATLPGSAMSDDSGFGMPDIGGMSGTSELTGSTLPDNSGFGMPNIGGMSGSSDLTGSTLPDNSGFGMPDIGGVSGTSEFTSSTLPGNSGIGMPDIGGMSTPASTDMPDFASNGIADVSNSGMPDLSTEIVGSSLPSVGAVEPMEKGGPFETPRLNPRQSGEEPECLRKWREEQKEKIRIKDEEEARKMEELRQKAKKELESWYKNYEEELQLTKKENRIAEEAFLADVNGLKPGTEWERVCRNSNFNSKVNHNKKDRSRMRNVLLQLKQTPLMNRE